jgi:hypothetical protein
MCRTLMFALLLTSTVQGSEQVVWQIGRPDHSYMEFAFARDYQAYAKAFGARPVVFDVGRSAAGRDWPFIQPGPNDVWSAARAQPRTVRFNLPEAPRGVYTLRIEFADVNSLTPPRYMVAIGERTGSFQLAPGGGDQSLSDPRAGKPQKLELPLPASYLKQGVNEIRLACIDGSWVQYDAITLLNDKEGSMPPAAIQSVTVHATPLFIRQDGEVRRVVDVAVATTGPAAGLALRVEAAGRTINVPCNQLSLFGSIVEEAGVPDLPGPLDVEVTATLNGQAKSATGQVLPQRKWRVYVAPSSHTDIGYTDIQPKCAERHCQNIDVAIDLLHRFPEFRWNTEVAWQAENYVNSRSGQRLEDFYRFAREGKIGIQALFCNELTGLCSHEEACRLTWFAHKLCHAHGIPYRSAMISDVPTQEATLPMILASAGIRYFSSGINNDRAYPFTHMQGKCPCWWEGPDGSRVLMMYTWQYAQAQQWGLTESFNEARSRVLQNLANYESRKDYPFDAVFLHGAVSDNQPLDARLAEVARHWNEKYEYPRIILSHNAEFFEYVEKHFGDKLPVFRGSAGTYWEDGAASSARETALNRNAHDTLANGEKLLALADYLGTANAYPAEDIYKAWRNTILFDEHTWGAYCSVSEPESAFTKAQWKIKSQFAVDADHEAATLLARGSRAMAGLVRAEGPSLVVFNPMSWARTDVLRVELPQGMTIAGPGVVCCEDGATTVAVVEEVPACGYKVLKLHHGPQSATAQRREGTTIESRFYRVRFDPTSGAIVSVFDKPCGCELIEANAPYGGNQYLYVSGGDNPRDPGHIPQGKPLTVSAPPKARLRSERLGDLGERMIVETAGVMTPKVVSEVTVWNDLKRVDIVNRLTKTQTYEKEAAYFAFPFAAHAPVIRHEIPAGIISVNKDMLPGACLDWFTVQHYVEIEDRGGATAWATPDAPLICLQDINRGKWQTSLPLDNGRLYSYIMTNYYYTNYLAGQGGDFTFRYAIASRPKADNVESARFGWAVSNPLLGVPIQTNASGSLPGVPTSLVSVAERNVVVTAIKRADEGKALIVRLWELSGQPSTAHLRLNSLIPTDKAQVCNLVEEPGALLEISGGQVAVPIRGAGLATVRIE